MKISIVISVLILAAAAGLGWQIDGKLAAARANERKFAAEAARFGISAGDAHPTRTTRRERVDRDAEARLVTIECIQLDKELETEGKSDETWQTRLEDCRQRISSLDASGLKILIAGVLASPELNEKKRAGNVEYLLRVVLAKKYPRAALEFLTEHSAALKDAKGTGSAISESLGELAKDDPLAAVEWMKKNATEFPDAMKALSLANVFEPVARKDPRLAFTLIAELGLNASNPFNPLSTIVKAAKTDEEMTATLAALREYREANRSNKAIIRATDENLIYFADALGKQRFEVGSKWIENAELNPKELDGLCQRLSIAADNEPGKWIEWIGATFSPGKGDGHIIELIGDWTEDDYQAAGKWLASAPEGAVKNAAISGYAQTVFKNDPETALQWIMTLPPGQGRDDTLKAIHMNWPKDDPAGKEAFVKEHGIK